MRPGELQKVQKRGGAEDLKLKELGLEEFVFRLHCIVFNSDRSQLLLELFVFFLEIYHLDVSVRWSNFVRRWPMATKLGKRMFRQRDGLEKTRLRSVWANSSTPSMAPCQPRQPARLNTALVASSQRNPSLSASKMEKRTIPF